MKAENLLKYLFTFTFASILLVGTAVAAPRAKQAVVACDYNYYDIEEIAGIMLEKSSNLAANGVHCGRYATEGSFKIPYKNGVKDGIAKEYHESGALMSEIPYKNGVKEGVAKIYNSAGELQQKIPYKNGAKDGIAKKYHDNGVLASETPYKNGARDGIEKEYDKDGVLRREYAYENDVRGVVKYYDSNGGLYEESTPFDRSVDNVIEGLGLLTTCSSMVTSLGLDDLYTKKLSDTEFFVRGNMDSLIRDIANGQGDTIDALAVLIDTDNKAFGERLQANFEIIFPNAAFDYLH